MRTLSRRLGVEPLEGRTLLSVSLVKDMNISPAVHATGEVAALGGAAYFADFDAASGVELWKSDGTVGGASLVKDVAPGHRGSGPASLAALGDVLLFSADDGVAGRELWKTDGTAAGTVMVADLTPGPAGADISPIVTAGGAAYFFVYGLTTDALWKSDGTAAGTVRLREFAQTTYPKSAVPEGAMAGDKFVFRAFDATAGSELWVTDGTPAGTRLLKDILPELGGSHPMHFTPVGGRVVFSAGDDVPPANLWVTDGTPEGTQRLRSFLPGMYPSVTIDDFTALGDRVYFRAVYSPPPPYEGIQGRTEVWATDGTPAGTGVAVHGGFHTHTTYATGDMIAAGGRLYFTAKGDTELWTSDGTQADTRPVAILPSLLTQLSAAGGRLYWVGGPAYALRHLWSVEPGAGAPVSLLDGNPRDLTPVGDALFALADDGLWAADAQSTRLARALTGGTSDGFLSDFTASGGALYFRASTPELGSELYRSDGTAAGTTLVPEVRAGQYPSDPRALLDVNGTLYYTVTDDALNEVVWRTDGTPGGTVAVPGVVLGEGAVTVGGNYFFTGRDEELWKTDLTAAGTGRVKDIWPGERFDERSYARELTPFGGLAYFFASDPTLGNALWRSDGTDAGTVPVKGFRLGPDHAYAYSLTVFNGLLYFMANDGTSSAYRLWRSDGTAAGTVPLTAPLAPGAFGPFHLTPAEGAMYFTYALPDGTELWKSDGTAAGTVRLAKSPQYYYPIKVLAAGGGAFVSLRVGHNTAYDLWHTDGTAAGTKRLPGLSATRTGQPGYIADAMLVVDDVLYFIAGGEYAYPYDAGLWRSDGTVAGTGPVDYGRGVQPAREIALAGNTLFFAGMGDALGTELWKVDTKVAGRQVNAGTEAGPAAKRALLPGETPGFVNVTGDSRGIRKVVLDVDDLVVRPTAADFAFEVRSDSTPGGWAAAPTPASVNVARGGGAGGTDRVTITWRDGQIRNTWLRVRALPGGRAAGAAGDVFTFGSLVGETGDGEGWRTVTAPDVLRVRANQSGRPVGAGNPYDFNGDRRVNALDVAIARANQGRALPDAVPPVAAAAPPRRLQPAQRSAAYVLA